MPNPDLGPQSKREPPFYLYHTLVLHPSATPWYYTLALTKYYPQSKLEPPNYLFEHLPTGRVVEITKFPHPQPSLVGVQKELVKYVVDTLALP